MVSILLTDTSDLRDRLSRALELKKNEVSISDYPDAIQLYKDEYPSVTIMNYKNTKSAVLATRDILKFDNKACVLALIEPNNEDTLKIAVEAGAKAVIKSEHYNINDVDKLVEDIYSVCCTIRDEKCMGCQLGDCAS